MLDLFSVPIELNIAELEKLSQFYFTKMKSFLYYYISGIESDIERQDSEGKNLIYLRF